ncbi:MAG: glutaredoxin [Candidatus Doudnabacteria bacterium CG10_big_fil_rev_8_21_14_0_10_41_10]|uniref:Glutaredoxin n=1 Tax=Candidatus Doudnabacteria bacterium CG10_big_fil_rev_8_21_14_0_10_41_10 TaxID=1974551 RepID=A0A2H0VE24_9BACT|nr:MAG: glutaredoxin [Candidatus Doudnabacteria bacterium CG10_big_fil_rev_8_21_14_0_10_41_10]
MKKYLLVLSVASALAIPFLQVQAVEKVTIEVFESDSCPHCRAFLSFIEDLQKERSDFELVDYDINTSEGRDFFVEVTDKLELPKATPIIYIGEEVLLGFDKPKTTGQAVIGLIDKTKEKESVRSLKEFINTRGSVNQNEDGEICDDGNPCELRTSGNTIIGIPFTGKTIDVGNFSLPTMSFVLGVVDGFNPCAMWVLVLLLGALVAVGSKRRMWEIAGLFLVAQALMYYLILNVWLYAWDFIGLDRIITPIIGVVAVGAGIYFLREYKIATDECKVTDLQQRAKIAKKVQEFAQKPITVVTAIGIIGLALSVNIFEFACSIGIPQTFTKILDINQLSFFGEQFYNGLYLSGYMLDDLIVFAIALYSFDKIGLTGKYTRFSHLIGGLLMVVLGLILLINPNFLVF